MAVTSGIALMLNLRESGLSPAGGRGPSVHPFNVGNVLHRAAELRIGEVG